MRSKVLKEGSVRESRSSLGTGQQLNVDKTGTAVKVVDEASAKDSLSSGSETLPGGRELHVMKKTCGDGLLRQLTATANLISAD